ncbi:unnamed protein product [Ixodes hexagonus]
MAEGRRSARSHKAVNYAKLDIGSDEDDDFKSAEAANSKRTKPKDKERIPSKDSRKKETEKPCPKDAGGVLAAGIELDSKPRRLSLDEKLFDRDLKAALTLSQMEAVPQTSAGALLSGADCVVSSEALELAGEVEVESSSDTGASHLPDMNHTLPGRGQDSYSMMLVGTANDSEGTEPSDSSEEEFSSPRTKRRKRSAKQGASRAGRSMPGQGACSVPDVKATATPAPPGPHSTPAVRKPSPVEATAKPLSAPNTLKPAPAPTACRPQLTSATTAVTKSGSHSVSLLAASVPKNVPRSVPTSSGSKVGTGTISIRLGLSRKGLRQPLHRVVKVLP